MEVNSRTEAQAAYLAGLIDGEGTITLIRKHSNENRQLSLSISSTERPSLDYVLSIVGAGKITRKCQRPINSLTSENRSTHPTTRPHISLYLI